MEFELIVTLNLVALVAVPPGVVTLILPVFAPEGTLTLILIAVSEVIGATFPPMVTFVAAARLVPVMVTWHRAFLTQARTS